jgi:hypothetical protein
MKIKAIAVISKKAIALPVIVQFNNRLSELFDIGSQHHIAIAIGVWRISL